MDLPSFPEVVDSTKRSSLVACHRQFYWGHLRHLRKSGPSIDLHFGGVFAKAIETTRKAYYRDGRSTDEALCIGSSAAITAWGDFDPGDLPKPKANKTLAACIDALWSYNERWPFDTDRLQPYRLPDGSPAIEQTFAFPIEGTAHPTTGNPIIYAGRFDMVGVWDKETIFICDEKTSTALGKNWRSNWPLRGQITGYVKGWNQYAPKRTKDAVIRGLGILQGEITTDEVFTTRPDWMVDGWYAQLRRDINGAIAAWQKMASSNEPHLNAWDQNFDNACSAYSGCPFTDLCSSDHPERWTIDFDEVIWDPLKREVESA